MDPGLRRGDEPKNSFCERENKKGFEMTAKEKLFFRGKLDLLLKNIYNISADAHNIVTSKDMPHASSILGRSETAIGMIEELKSKIK